MKSKEKKNEAAQFVITLLLLKAVGGTGPLIMPPTMQNLFRDTSCVYPQGPPGI